MYFQSIIIQLKSALDIHNLLSDKFPNLSISPTRALRPQMVDIQQTNSLNLTLKWYFLQH